MIEITNFDIGGDSICALVRERISARHDGEPDAASRDLDAAHLSGCGECARFEHELDGLVPLFDAARSAEPRSDLFAGIAARIEARGEARSVSRKARVFGGWTLRAAAGLVGFLSVFAFSRSNGTGRTGAPATASIDHSLALFAHASRALTQHGEIVTLPERALLLQYSASEDQR